MNVTRRPRGARLNANRERRGRAAAEHDLLQLDDAAGGEPLHEHELARERPVFEGLEEDVRAASAQAGIPFERVLESLRIDGNQSIPREGRCG